MSLAKVINFLGLANRQATANLATIRRRQTELSALTDAQLKLIAYNQSTSPSVTEVFAITTVIAERVLGMSMFDTQLLGALALQGGNIAEMQTGEGKTLAAVPAIVWFALQRRGVHVLTANDYLAKRDSEWMGEIYRWFGLTVGYLSQHTPPDVRRAAYGCDVLYATANEIGFDLLRDGLAREPEQIVQRELAFAVIDEADSILLDEARIPLVIAGGDASHESLAHRADAIVRTLRPHADYFAGEFARDVQLTDAGIARVESALGCRNIFSPENLDAHTAIQDALHAHVLLRRDVDYIVKNNVIELVDACKGRIAENRRWPAGLHSAIEAKEHVALKDQGRILGSITIQSLAAQYERICGMTGTAATQAGEFWKFYNLPVVVIPTNRPVIREDLEDIVYSTKAARDEALVKEIAKVHATGRPVLVGTASVEESERLSRRLHLCGIPHAVLNARHDEAEAAIVAEAGTIGAVTISTNMAGRGTDIVLGGSHPEQQQRVIELGGLCVLGTTRHDARRIDNQLRGRAGRQGDPGSSRFFLSLEDDLLVRYGIGENRNVASVQRTAEGQNMAIRQMLWKYESLVDLHRREVSHLRRNILLSPEWSIASLLPESKFQSLQEQVGSEQLQRAGRRIALYVIDDLWPDYLANVAELRGGIHWVQWGGRDPLYEFLTGVEGIYDDLHVRLHEEVTAAFETAEISGDEIHFVNEDRFKRGATWTYMTTDQPFGTLSERIIKSLVRQFKR